MRMLELRRRYFKNKKSNINYNKKRIEMQKRSKRGFTRNMTERKKRLRRHKGIYKERCC